MSYSTAAKRGNLPPRADTANAKRKLRIIDSMLDAEKAKEDEDGERIMWGGQRPEFLEMRESSEEEGYEGNSSYETGEDKAEGGTEEHDGSEDIEGGETADEDEEDKNPRNGKGSEEAKTKG